MHLSSMRLTQGGPHIGPHDSEREKIEIYKSWALMGFHKK